MRPARPALTQEQQQMVRRLRGEGMTWQKAARAVGCSFTSAWFIGEGRGGRRARPASWTPRPGSLTIADREEITIGLVRVNPSPQLLSGSTRCRLRSAGRWRPMAVATTTGPGQAT